MVTKIARIDELQVVERERESAQILVHTFHMPQHSLNVSPPPTASSRWHL